MSWSMKSPYHIVEEGLPPPTFFLSSVILNPCPVELVDLDFGICCLVMNVAGWVCRMDHSICVKWKHGPLFLRFVAEMGIVSWKIILVHLQQNWFKFMFIQVLPHPVWKVEFSHQRCFAMIKPGGFLSDSGESQQFAPGGFTADSFSHLTVKT